MSEPSDHDIDDQLRNVPVPSGIEGGVAPAVLFDAAAIDRLLCRVDVPAGLADRVRRGPPAAGSGSLSVSGPMPRSAPRTPPSVGRAGHGDRAGHGEHTGDSAAAGPGMRAAPAQWHGQRRKAGASAPRAP